MGNFKTIVDKAYLWKGRLIHIIALENQMYVDYRMVLTDYIGDCLRCKGESS